MERVVFEMSSLQLSKQPPSAPKCDVVCPGPLKFVTVNLYVYQQWDTQSSDKPACHALTKNVNDTESHGADREKEQRQRRWTERETGRPARERERGGSEGCIE